MHDWLFDKQTCNQSLFAEDCVLKILHDCRAQLAERMLHSLKATLPVADDVHFENFFYSALRLGVQMQARSEADLSRMNYVQLQTFDAASARGLFFREYTPGRMRAELRAKIFEASDGAETREKMYDWMRANVPVGFCDDLAADERQSKWLHEMCHDCNYRVTDAALSFMLCRMRVLVFDPAAMCPSASRVLGCGPARVAEGGGAAVQQQAVAQDHGRGAAGTTISPSRVLLVVAVAVIVFAMVIERLFHAKVSSF